MVSSTPGGSGLPIGLIPGALPSDQASRHTLNTTAMRFPFGQRQLDFGTGFPQNFKGLACCTCGSARTAASTCDGSSPSISINATALPPGASRPT